MPDRRVRAMTIEGIMGALELSAYGTKFQLVGECCSRDKLAGYLSHDLSNDEMRSVHQHIGSCVPCLRILKEILKPKIRVVSLA